MSECLNRYVLTQARHLLGGKHMEQLNVQPAQLRFSRSDLGANRIVYLGYITRERPGAIPTLSRELSTARERTERRYLVHASGVNDLWIEDPHASYHLLSDPRGISLDSLPVVDISNPQHSYHSVAQVASPGNKPELVFLIGKSDVGVVYSHAVVEENEVRYALLEPKGSAPKSLWKSKARHPAEVVIYSGPLAEILVFQTIGEQERFFNPARTSSGTGGSGRVY